MELVLHVKVVNVCVTVVQITTCLLFHMLAAVKTLGNGVVAISEVMSITGTKLFFQRADCHNAGYSCSHSRILPRFDCHLKPITLNQVHGLL